MKTLVSRSSGHVMFAYGELRRVKWKEKGNLWTTYGERSLLVSINHMEQNFKIMFLCLL